MPMNASICAGLRRTSFSRSAAVRSGLATISAARSAEMGCGTLAQPARKIRKKANRIALLEQECTDGSADTEDPERIDFQREKRGRARCSDCPQAPVGRRRRAKHEAARKRESHDERCDGALDRNAPRRFLEALPEIGDPPGKDGRGSTDG